MVKVQLLSYSEKKNIGSRKTKLICVESNKLLDKAIKPKKQVTIQRWIMDSCLVIVLCRTYLFYLTIIFNSHIQTYLTPISSVWWTVYWLLYQYIQSNIYKSLSRRIFRQIQRYKPRHFSGSAFNTVFPTNTSYDRFSFISRWHDGYLKIEST